MDEFRNWERKMIEMSWSRNVDQRCDNKAHILWMLSVSPMITIKKKHWVNITSWTAMSVFRVPSWFSTSRQQHLIATPMRLRWMDGLTDLKRWRVYVCQQYSWIRKLIPRVMMDTASKFIVAKWTHSAGFIMVKTQADRIIKAISIQVDTSGELSIICRRDWYEAEAID